MDPQIAQVSQHISIAFMKFESYLPAARAFELKVRVRSTGFRSVTPDQLAADSDDGMDGVREVQHQVQQLWGEIWAQLDDARVVAAAMGRDTTRFDNARLISRKYGSGATLDVGPMERASGRVYSQAIEKSVGPPELIADAMSLLLIAVPEVEMPKSRGAEPVADLRGSRMGMKIVVGLGIALAVAFVVAWFRIRSSG